METIIKGGNLMLFLGGKSIPLATSHTLSISADTSDVSNKDVASGAWRAEQVSQLSWEASTDNLYCYDGYADLFDAMVKGTAINAYFATKVEADGSSLPSSGTWTADSNSDYYNGLVIITSLQVNAQNGENATLSATFTGVGELKHNGEGATFEPEAEVVEVDDPDDLRVAPVTFSPASWGSGTTQEVTLSSATNGASIYYTTNGSEPTSESTAYNNTAIILSGTSTIKAIAIKSGLLNSVVTTQTYTKPTT